MKRREIPNQFTRFRAVSFCRLGRYPLSAINLKSGAGGGGGAGNVSGTSARPCHCLITSEATSNETQVRAVRRRRATSCRVRISSATARIAGLALAGARPKGRSNATVRHRSLIKGATRCVRPVSLSGVHLGGYRSQPPHGPRAHYSGSVLRLTFVSSAVIRLGDTPS